MTGRAILTGDRLQPCHAGELARQSWGEAVAVAQRNRAASESWEDTCREAVRRSGPAHPRPRSSSVVLVVVVVGGGAMR